MLEDRDGRLGDEQQPALYHRRAPLRRTATRRGTSPPVSTPGLYSVYIRIPAIHGTTEGALAA